jgi:hypothetical protein
MIMRLLTSQSGPKRQLGYPTARPIPSMRVGTQHKNCAEVRDLYLSAMP